MRTEYAATAEQDGTEVPVPRADRPDIDAEVMGALAQHVPLTLLLDLSEPAGPDSREIAAVEGGSADWL